MAESPFVLIYGPRQHRKTTLAQAAEDAHGEDHRSFDDAATLAAEEVKGSTTVTAADFRGIRKLQGAVGNRLAGGPVVYDGEASVGFGDGLHAVPIRALRERAAVTPVDHRATGLRAPCLASRSRVTRDRRATRPSPAVTGCSQFAPRHPRCQH